MTEINRSLNQTPGKRIAEEIWQRAVLSGPGWSRDFVANLIDTEIALVSQHQADQPVESTELRPCPFCGGEAELIINLGHEHYVECKRCWVHGSKFLYDSDKAMIAWNARQPEREAVTPENLQEAVRDRIHWHGLNGLNVANDLLERFEILRRGSDD